MPSDERDFIDRIANILSLLFSIATIISAFVYSMTEIKSRWWVYAVAIAIIVLIWAFHRRYKRKRLFNRVILQRSGEGKPVGFNGAIAYTQDDHDRFFGRENDIVTFLAQIKQDDYRIGVLYGESGVGKTSFIQAGIVPRVGNEYQCCYISLNNLPHFESLEPITTDDKSEIFLSFLFNQVSKKLSLNPPIKSFVELMRSFSSSNKKAVIFFLDQFEQIFDRVPEAARTHFANVLQHQRELIDLPLKFVISVRSDYFGLVFQLFELEKRNIYFLSKFNPPQAREIIRCSCGLPKNLEETKPDHLLLDFEDEIITDLQDSDGCIHPVEISLICWQMLRTIGELTRAQYLEGGRKHGWLDRYLDDVMQPLSNKQQALQVLSSLITGDKSDNLSVPDISTRSGVAKSETQKLLDYFEQSKLIVKEWSEA